MIQNPEMMTINEVADLFRVDRKTIDKWHRTKPDFPGKLSVSEGSVRFLRSEIRDYIGRLPRAGRATKGDG